MNDGVSAWTCLQRHFVVLVLGIAAQNDLHGGLGQFGFHGQHGLRVRGGLGRRFAAQLQHAGHVFHVLVANLFRFCIVVQIELAAGQRHAGLIERRQSHAGVVKAGLRIDSEQYSLIGGVNETQVGGPDDLVDGSDDFRKLGLVSSFRAMRSSTGCSGLRPALLMASSSMQEA